MKKDGEFEVYGLYHLFEAMNYNDEGEWVEQCEELIRILLLTEEEKEQQQQQLNEINPIMYNDSYELHCLKFIIKKMDANSTSFWLPQTLISTGIKNSIITNIDGIKITPDWLKEDSDNEQ